MRVCPKRACESDGGCPLLGETARQREADRTHKTTFSSRYALPNFRHSFIPARPDIGERSSVRDVVNGEESRLSALEATPRETCH